MIIIVLVLLLGAIGFGCLAIARGMDRRATARRSVIQSKYAPDDLFVSVSGHFIGFRFSDDKLIIGDYSSERVLPGTAITAVDVLANEVVVSKSGVAGLGLGTPIGVIGGGSVDTTSQTQTRSLGLRLLLDDPANPVHEVYFAAWPGRGVHLSHPLAQQGVALVHRFRAHCENAIRRREAPFSGEAQSSPSVL